MSTAPSEHTLAATSPRPGSVVVAPFFAPVNQGSPVSPVVLSPATAAAIRYNARMLSGCASLIQTAAQPGATPAEADEYIDQANRVLARLRGEVAPSLAEAAPYLLDVVRRLIREDEAGELTMGLIEDARAAIAKAEASE